MEGVDFFEDLKNLAVSRHVNGADSDPEQEHIIRYNQAKLNNNIEEQYEFVDTYERGGLAYPNSQIHNILCKTLKVNLLKGISILNEKDDVATVVNIIYTFDENTAIDVLSNSQVTNPLILFELIRQFTQSFPQNTDLFSRLSSGLVRLSVLNREMFLLVIKKFQNNEVFLRVLGSSCSQLQSDILISVIDELNFQYGRADGTDKGRVLLESIGNQHLASFMDIAAKVILEKFERTLHDRNASGLFRIFISQHFELILESLIHTISDEAVLESFLNKLTCEMERFLSLWFKTSTQMTTMYFIISTKFYIFQQAISDGRVNFQIGKDANCKYSWLLSILERYPDKWLHRPDEIQLNSLRLKMTP